MNKKGFTLVEVISVLVILGIILIVTFTQLTNFFKNADIKIEESKLLALTSGVEDYFVENNNYVKNEGNNYCIPLKELIQEGYVKKGEIEGVAETSIVNVEVKNNKLLITLSRTCTITEKKVIFNLNGPKNIKINKGTTYADQGFLAKDENGNDISNLVNTNILDKNLDKVLSIDTSKENIYIIEYTLRYNNKIYSIDRKSVV